ncbi:ompW family protein [Escherichia coli 2-222-05_S1_C1]|nr:ompW family protein [Escherichia coli 2-222-05_S1_C1]KDX81629.1 ompW family protein [Escherichia coli 2-222-05_S1_C3]
MLPRKPCYVMCLICDLSRIGGAQQHDSVRLDPWVFMFSAGYRF